jgi:hypothetical protein
MASVRKIVTILFVLLVVDLLFIYVLTFGMYSVPGQIAFLFFGPAMMIADRLAPLLHVPSGVNPMADLFVIQFALLAAFSFGVLALKKWVP